jgi:hypothetical protein
MDSQLPVCSLVVLASLTVYPTASQHGVFSARVGDAKTKRPAHPMTCWALCSGDVLLSHGLSPYYHRGCSVSLPCSEWERVVPLRYCHQSAEPHGRSRCYRSDASARPNLWRLRATEVNRHYLFSKEHDFQSAIPNRKSFSFPGIYIQEFISAEDSRRYNFRLRFVLRSFVSSVCRSAKRGTA